MSSSYQINTLVAEQTPTKIKVSWRAVWSKQLTAYLFLLPAILVFAIFAWLPIARAIQMSFHDVSLNGTATWVGLDNYALMLRDPVFSIAWRNSFEFAWWSIVLGFVVPLSVALFVREMRVAQGFLRVVYFLPTVVPAAIAIIIWRYIYDPDAGILNALLSALGLPEQQWLGNAALVKPSVIVMMTWGAFGATALIYLSSLQEIPGELYEAAELDGATPLQRIRHITLPQLYPVISTLFVLQILAVVQVFTEPFLMTNGGPGRETLTPTLYIYNRSFIRVDLGYAAAWSVTLIIVLLLFSIVYRIINHRVNNAAEN